MKVMTAMNGIHCTTAHRRLQGKERSALKMGGARAALTRQRAPMAVYDENLTIIVEEADESGENQ